MSTDSPAEGHSASDWVSQAEAARIQGVTRQAINKLVRAGRFRSLRIGGHVLVHREDVEGFRPRPPGRPTVGGTSDYERIKATLASCDRPTLDRVYEFLRSMRPPHPVESRLGADAEVILEALNRSGELTTRMFRGIIAEAAFDVHIVRPLVGWQSHAIEGNAAFDFDLSDGVGHVRVQVKLQRSEKGVAVIKSGDHLVETQRTRGGKRRGGGEADGLTRPYRYGDFDVLAVCLQPSTGRWDEFRYTVGDWLRPRKGVQKTMATLQPVSAEPDDDWSNDFLTCVDWFRGAEVKTIRGRLGGRGSLNVE